MEIKEPKIPNGKADYGQLNMKKDYDVRLIILLISYLLTEDLSDNIDETKTRIEEFIIGLKKLSIFLKEDVNNTITKFTDKYNELIISQFFNENEIENYPEKDKKYLPFYKDFDKNVPLANILLYLCKPDDHEPIAATGNKEKIISAFNFLTEEKKDGDDNNVKVLLTDEKIKLIRNKLIELSKVSENKFSFYDKPFIYIWNFDSAAKEIGLDELQALEFKKQIVLYGPPGTSKTYAANEMAKAFVNQKLFKYLNNDGKEVFLELLLNEDNKKELYDYFINNLQLHANYGYEDFVRGLRISEGGTKFQDGNFLKLIKKVNSFSGENKFQLAGFIDDKDDYSKVPFVLILDEINRTDLSKLFGELFSGLENRGKEIELPGIDDDSEPLKIKIPKNLYTIGTMNEIDFSVERIDFALRRRFCWYEYNFDKTRLEQIMNEKIKGFKKERDKKAEEEKKINKDEINKDEIKDISDFNGLLEQHIANAVRLNNKIKNDPELGLGKSWLIGHTFFAEVIDVFYQKINESSAKRINKEKEIRESIETIWDISIGPMLEAYLMNLDSNHDNIAELKKIFIKPKKSKKEKSDN